jgi:hypothetical protein
MAGQSPGAGGDEDRCGYRHGRADGEGVSQADARFAANPSLAIVWTRDMTNDIAMAMIAETRKGVYLGSKRRLAGLAFA